jgi:UV DNA damage endonuclease
MDLMIEAKDKEQAVFELMRTYRLDGWNHFNAVVPYERDDDNRVALLEANKPKNKKKGKKIKDADNEADEPLEESQPEQKLVPDEELGMGGPLNRVYWPVGMEEWLRPKKREVRKKGVPDEDLSVPTPYNFIARMEISKREKAPLDVELVEKIREAKTFGELKKLVDAVKERNTEEALELNAKASEEKKKTPKKAPAPKKRKAKSPSLEPEAEEEEDESELSELEDSGSEEEEVGAKPTNGKARATGAAPATPSRLSRRTSSRKVSYIESAMTDEED